MSRKNRKLQDDMSDEVKPFRIEVSEADLRDLRQRLKQHPLARARDGRGLVAGRPARLSA